MTTTTETYVPNFQTQFRYLVEWFGEFSEMQKGDFLPILVQRFGHKTYVNGLLPGMEALGNSDERPPSLFQCRMKLFLEWTESWSQQDREKLLLKIKEIDPTFSDKYEKEINCDKSTSPQQREEPELQLDLNE